MSPYDRPAGPASKALFGAGLAAVVIGRAVGKYRNRKRPRNALEGPEETAEP